MGCDVKEKEVPKECNGKVGSVDKIKKKGSSIEERNVNEISMLQLAALWSAAYLSMFTFADTALSAITAPPPQLSCDPASPWLWFAYIHYLIRRPPQTLLPKLPSHDKTREEQSHRCRHPSIHILPKIHIHDPQNTWQDSRSHHTSACHLVNPLSLVCPQRLLYHHTLAQDQYPSVCR